MKRLFPFLILCSLVAGAQDLASIRTTPNLEKRAGLAVDYAMKSVAVAREAS